MAVSRSMFRRFTIPAMVFLNLIFGNGIAWAEPKIGEPAPPLILNELDGSTFDLGKLQGKVVLVNFWASWCAPCRKEMPRLDAFYRLHRGRGLEIIGVSIDRTRDRDKARKMIAALAYPAAMANENELHDFGVPEGVPVTYVVDSRGVLRDKFIDVYDQLLKDVVVPLLPR